VVTLNLPRRTRVYVFVCFVRCFFTLVVVTSVASACVRRHLWLVWHTLVSTDSSAFDSIAFVCELLLLVCTTWVVEFDGRFCRYCSHRFFILCRHGNHFKADSAMVKKINNKVNNINNYSSNNKTVIWAQTSADAKILTKSDLGFQSGLPD